jgi:hypothetical protein
MGKTLVRFWMEMARDRNDGCVLDMALQFAFRNGFQKRLHFFTVSAALEFHPPVLEIAHPAHHFVAARHLLYREPEAHSLDAAFVKNLAACHSGRAMPRRYSAAVSGQILLSQHPVLSSTPPWR